MPLNVTSIWKHTESIWASLKNKMGLLTTNKNEKSLRLKIKSQKDKRKNVGDGTQQGSKRSVKFRSLF